MRKHPGRVEQAWDAVVEFCGSVVVSALLDEIGKVMCLLTISIGNRIRRVRWAGPRESSAAILEMLVGLPCQLSDASNKTWALGGAPWHLLPPVGWVSWLPCAHLCPGTHHFITLARGLNILPYTSHILKYLLDMGLGCCHNILNQIREVLLTSVTRQRLACSGCYFSSSLKYERVKNCLRLSFCWDKRTKSVLILHPSPFIFFERYELCFSLALQKWLFNINTDSLQCLQVSWYSKSPCHVLLEYRVVSMLPTLSIQESWVKCF